MSHPKRSAVSAELTEHVKRLADALESFSSDFETYSWPDYSDELGSISRSVADIPNAEEIGAALSPFWKYLEKIATAAEHSETNFSLTVDLANPDRPAGEVGSTIRVVVPHASLDWTVKTTLRAIMNTMQRGASALSVVAFRPADAVNLDDPTRTLRSYGVCTSDRLAGRAGPRSEMKPL